MTGRAVRLLRFAAVLFALAAIDLAMMHAAATVRDDIDGRLFYDGLCVGAALTVLVWCFFASRGVD